MEIKHEHLRNLTEWGLFSVNKAVIWMFIAAFVAFLVIYLAGRRSMVPRRYQSFMELLLTLIREKLVIETMGHEGLPFFPFIASLFFFIFFCNIVGIFPLGHYGFTATSNINVTGTLTVLVFIVVLIMGVRKKGFYGYFVKSFIPHGVPKILVPLIYPVELISLFAKHFALAVRLFANMLAGHMVILVFATMAALLLKSGLSAFPSAFASTGFLTGTGIFLKGVGYTVLSPVALAVTVLMLAFEIFVALIQSFIFAILAALYIGDSLREHH